MPMLKVGDQAPEFVLKDENGKEQSLKKYLGKWVVVYFYPKDDTSGCTKEACGIRDNFAEFKKQGIVVLGISKDTPASHMKFKEKYSLPFTLLSDPDKKVIKRYGAARGNFTARISYIVNKKGIVVKVYSQVTPATHAAEILKDVAALKQ